MSDVPTHFQCTGAVESQRGQATDQLAENHQGLQQGFLQKDTTDTGLGAGQSHTCLNMFILSQTITQVTATHDQLTDNKESLI